MRRHSEYEMMVAAYDGLSPVERKEMDAHLAECAVCVAALAEYRQMDAEIRSAHTLKASAGLRLRFENAVSGAGQPAVLKAGPVRLAPPEPKVTLRRPAPASRPVMRLALPVAGVLLFVLAIFVTLQIESGRAPGATGPRAVPPPVQPTVTEIVFKCGASQWDVPFDKVIADFEAANPDVRVNLVPTDIYGENEAAWHQAMKEAADTSDVYCSSPTPTELQAGAAADLTSYIDRDPAFQPDDFYPGMLRKWQDSGAILDIRLYFYPYFIAYSPEAFDEANLPYPKPGWTWDEFVSDAKQLTRRDGDTVERWGFYEMGATVFINRLWSAFGPDLQAPGYAVTADLLRWYQSVYVQDRALNVPPALDWYGANVEVKDSLADLLKADKVAMWDGNWVQNNHASGPQHVVPLPEPNQWYSASIAGLALSGQTAFPDESWRWISYLSRHLPVGGQSIPARRSQVEDAAFWQTRDPDTAAAYRYVIDHLNVVDLQGLPQEAVAFQSAVIAVAKGEKTAEEALAVLDAQVKLRGGPTERAANAEKAAGEDARIVSATPTPGGN